MKVGAIYKKAVLAADVDDSLGDVAARMRAHEVSALGVYEGRALIGIVTERDVVQAVVDDVDLKITGVTEYMTPDVVTVTPSTDIRDAARTMVDLGARHLPVMQEGTMVGMVSARDLVRVLARGE